jgi:hypothetical protein
MTVIATIEASRVNPAATAMARSNSGGSTEFRHPVAGLLSLDYVKLAAASEYQQDLTVMLPANQDTADKLRQVR